MHFFINLLIALMFSSYSFAQNYGYDKNYQSYLDENGVEIDDKQKNKVREDIKKWANFYLQKQ